MGTRLKIISDTAMTLPKHVEVLESLKDLFEEALARSRTTYEVRIGQRINENHDMHLTCPVVKIGPSVSAFDRAVSGTLHGTEERIAAVKAYRRSLRKEAERLLPVVKAVATKGLKLAIWIDTSFEINVKPARPTGRSGSRNAKKGEPTK